MTHMILYGSVIGALSVIVIVMARQRRTAYASVRRAGSGRPRVR